jgi:dCTP deaminase
VTFCDSHILQAISVGQLSIEPWSDVIYSGRLQPCSIDLLLGEEFGELNDQRHISFNPKSPRPPETRITKHKSYMLRPQGFVLGTTVETVKIGSNVRASVEGKSSLGRAGLAVHVTAGFVDPGFHGKITLELYNCGPCIIELWPGQRICQLAVHQLSGKPERLYGDPSLGSHYQGQTGTQGAKW